MSVRVMVKWRGRNIIKDWEKFAAAFDPYLQLAHNKCVLAIVADAVAWSRVDTGRMRAGWLPILLDEGYPYTQQLLGTASPNYEASLAPEGTFQRFPLKTVVENGVVYTQYVEEKVGVFDMEGKSAFMRSPVMGLEEAGQRWADLYARNMQTLLDNLMEAWNKGTLSSMQEPIDLPPPSPSD